MNRYCEGALDYLRCAYEPEDALFSFSSRLQGSEIVNDFRTAETLRYTINTFLGLREAERWGGPIDWLGDVTSGVRVFVERHEAALSTPADIGLLLALLAGTDPAHPAVDRCLARVHDALHDKVVRRLNMQDAAWMLWGCCATHDRPHAEHLAHQLFDLMLAHFVHRTSGLPRHNLQRYRANIVSFGSVAYFLRAMYEYTQRFGDQRARALFLSGVRTALAIQGPQGEWPWMVNVRTGRVIELHPVFTVHQDSMAMLFLLPARDLGVLGVERAIARSLSWNLGSNELGLPMVRHEPCFWIYRAIERDERQPRVRRYLRALRSAYGQRSLPPRRVRVNRECRSYHLGWVLFTWSQHADLPLLDAPRLGPAPVSVS